MKKLVIFFCLLAVLSCKKNALEPSEANCEKAAAEYEKVIAAWSQDIGNKTKCEAVKKSLNEIIRSCNVYTPAQRKVYEDQIKDIDCN
ncbi:hypothetical protein [Runella sp.]|jgi:hypothetical protein|uniref:hypothetical protein n=1 Tax=Runella sp. TaxID=1960881 RepID=UPI00260EC613|nr:hypothetical protein [Runella sp.]